MSYESRLTFTYINFMGRDFDAEIGYTITDWGRKAIVDYTYGGDPGWGPEWDVDYINIKENREGDLGPEFVATGKLFQSLSNSTKIYDAIVDDIANRDDGDDWGDY